MEDFYSKRIKLVSMLFALGTTNTPKTNAIREALTDCPFMA